MFSALPVVSPDEAWGQGDVHMCACEIKQLHNISVLSVNLVGEREGQSGK